MRAGFLLAAGKVSISPPAAMMRAASRPPLLTTRARPPALTIASVTSTVVASAPPASRLGTIWAIVGRASGKDQGSPLNSKARRFQARASPPTQGRRGATPPLTCAEGVAVDRHGVASNAIGNAKIPPRTRSAPPGASFKASRRRGERRLGNGHTHGTPMDALAELRAKIASGTAVVGIYGLGYVGLPLALAI